jgi:hypothetical protein
MPPGEKLATPLVLFPDIFVEHLSDLILKRKTRCDAGLPKCGPCERSGAVCEYFDTAKGKKISRTYVIRLQDRVRALESELSQLTENESFEPDPEGMIRPGGLVTVVEGDEPRYLGSSSGIAITRLVMDAAKRNTDTRTIREVVPEVRGRTKAAQSPNNGNSRKISYPLISAVAAPNLPSRNVTDKLVEIFYQKCSSLPTFLIASDIILM